MKKSFAKKWSNIRTRGIYRFILLHFFLPFGLGLPILLVFARLIRNILILKNSPFFDSEFIWASFLLTLKIYPVLSILLGIFQWFINEHRFKKIKID